MPYFLNQSNDQVGCRRGICFGIIKSINPGIPRDELDILDWHAKYSSKLSCGSRKDPAGDPVPRESVGIQDALLEVPVGQIFQGKIVGWERKALGQDEVEEGISPDYAKARKLV